MLKEYLAKTIPQLVKLIYELKNSTQDEQKIAVVFKHFVNPTRKYTIYIKSKNKEMRARDHTNDIIAKLLESFSENYETEENILRNGSTFVYDCVDLTLVQFHAIKLKRGGSYISSPKWIYDKIATINPKITKDNCCFAYSIVAALHHQEIDHHPERIKKLAPYVNNYNWK